MGWLKRRLESLLDNLIFAAIGAGGAAVWIAMKSLPLPIIVGTFGLIFVIILVVIRFVILRFFKNGKLQSTFQIYDAEMVKHLTQIKKMLDTFKKQLRAISNKKGLLRNLGIAIEKQRGFYQVWEHCPSMLKAGQDLRLSRVLYEAKLKKKLVTTEDDTYIRGRMKALAEAIDNCLSDGEYLNHSCSNCIEKRKQLSGITNEESLVLTPHTYAIGLSGMTGYPEKPDNADWLCLEVAVKPISKPIDTLDLLIEEQTIHANRWTGKNVAAFRVYFNVTGWKWKGEIQVELQARIEGAVRSSVRIPIDFDVEHFGRHPI